ncbi:hypothetical protein BJY00DRAFT_106138 [Aspergillus carlsbadensis]|nr:hypothetical protein BJY00DRAFT_106138 [Aspergillus carlsbadensis]
MRLVLCAMHLAIRVETYVSQALQAGWLWAFRMHCSSGRTALVPTGLTPGKSMSWPAKMNLKIISTILAPTTLVRMSQVILRHVAQRHVAQRTNCFDGPELGTALFGVYPRALMQWHRLAGSSLSAGARENPETPRGHRGSSELATRSWIGKGSDWAARRARSNSPQSDRQLHTGSKPGGWMDTLLTHVQTGHLRWDPATTKADGCLPLSFSQTTVRGCIVSTTAEP